METQTERENWNTRKLAGKQYKKRASDREIRNQ